jgi:hypothetical protein
MLAAGVSREGGPIGERADNGNSGAVRHAGDALGPRADNGSEPDSFFPAHSEDALT